MSTNTELQTFNGGAMAVADTVSAHVMEQVIATGNLQALSPPQRVEYYNALCRSLNLNPLTKPFEYITLNGKLTLYAKKDATDQIRRSLDVSIVRLEKLFEEGLYIVTAHATLPSGRVDESTGAVTIENLKGEAKANAIMKAETKAKRRVTLSICGLGFLDETEVDTIADAGRPMVDHSTGEVIHPSESPQQKWERLRAEIINTIKSLPKPRREYWLAQLEKRFGNRTLAKTSVAQLEALNVEIGHSEASRAAADMMPQDDPGEQYIDAQVRDEQPATFAETVRAKAGVPTDSPEVAGLRGRINMLAMQQWPGPETRGLHLQEFTRAHFGIEDYTACADVDTLQRIADAIQGKLNNAPKGNDLAMAGTADDLDDPFAE